LRKEKKAERTDQFQKEKEEKQEEGDNLQGMGISLGKETAREGGD